MDQAFQCYEVKEENGKFIGSTRLKKISELPSHNTLVKVLYSGLNYKDALSASGNRGVTKNYPHTPGIDAAGEIISSEDNSFQPGQAVIITSYDLGMNTSGGFGQYIRVPSEWIVPLPESLTLRDSMILGTAGLTAAQGITAMLHNGQKPEQGPVLVTGSRGAVGSMAIMILAKLGFEVVAGVSTIAKDSVNLKELGAKDVVDSSLTSDQSGKPLLRPKWAGAFDVIGGNTLSTILKSTSYGGNVVCVGNIEDFNLNTTVFPFILNGINLLGIGTQDTPMALRRKLWNLLASEWKPEHLENISTETSLIQLDRYLKIMQEKKSRGRVLLNLWD